MTTYSHSFDSWTDLLVYAQGDSTAPDKTRKSRTGEADFTGSDSWDHAIQLGTSGYVAEIPSVDAGIANVLHSLGERADTFGFTFDVTGSMVDVPRFLTGEPECMIEPNLNTAGNGRVVKIVVSGAASSGVDPESIRNRGAAIMALLETLRLAGVPAEIWTVWAVTGRSSGRRSGSNRHVTSCCVQRSSEPVDIGRVMFALAHPSALRRIVFSVKEREAYNVRETFGVADAGTGYGRPSDATADDVPMDNNDIAIIVPQASNEWLSKNGASWVEETLTAAIGS